jgi:hypothetical protein
VLALLLAFAPAGAAQSWRPMTERELKAAIPDRADVEGEQIETELRTAAGVTTGGDVYVAGVVLITAGYSADGKYSHWLTTKAPLRIGEMSLAPNHYVFGYRRIDNETLEVRFYEAANGRLMGAVKAHKDGQSGPIRALAIAPVEDGRLVVRIGRFSFYLDGR